jgi:hypothetical protein
VTDKFGNKILDRTYGGSGGEGVNSIRATSDGGYILGGYSNSPLGFDKNNHPLMAAPITGLSN